MCNHLNHASKNIIIVQFLKIAKLQKQNYLADAHLEFIIQAIPSLNFTIHWSEPVEIWSSFQDDIAIHFNTNVYFFGGSRQYRSVTRVTPAMIYQRQHLIMFIPERQAESVIMSISLFIKVEISTISRRQYVKWNVLEIIAVCLQFVKLVNGTNNFLTEPQFSLWKSTWNLKKRITKY